MNSTDPRLRFQFEINDHSTSTDISSSNNATSNASGNALRSHYYNYRPIYSNNGHLEALPFITTLATECRNETFRLDRIHAIPGPNAKTNFFQIDPFTKNILIKSRENVMYECHLENLDQKKNEIIVHSKREIRVFPKFSKIPTPDLGPTKLHQKFIQAVFSHPATQNTISHEELNYAKKNTGGNFLTEALRATQAKAIVIAITALIDHRILPSNYQKLADQYRYNNLIPQLYNHFLNEFQNFREFTSPIKTPEANVLKWLHFKLNEVTANSESVPMEIEASKPIPNNTNSQPIQNCYSLTITEPNRPDSWESFSINAIFGK